MQILIVGTGYVGLVTGACFAEMGHIVTCLDIDHEKIEMLQKGAIPIYEPGLEEIVKRNIREKRLFFTTNYEEAVRPARCCFIAVPTPSKEDGSCDISYVETAARQIASYMDKDYKVIVNKSTVPVGTAHRVKTVMLAIRSTLNLDVVSAPEFLKEGNAVSDCLRPDRIIIGSDTSKPVELLKEIYAPFTLNHERILVMDTLSAEMTKYAANAMLATRISFMNEIADICKKVGANVNEVRKGIGSDSRIGYSFLYPGVGYGGSCFPKDIRALIKLAEEIETEPLVLQAADAVNNRQKKLLAGIMTNYFSKKGGLKGKTIGIWGLAFKPDTDDMREAPSLVLIEDLIRQGAHLQVFDPVAMPNAKKLLNGFPNISWCISEFEAAKNADAIALLTEWKQFRLVDFSPVKKEMKGIAFFDGRNQYKPLDMKNKGFDYIAIGVPDAIHDR
ncbi:MAG: UDP-glucose 6-dehydrogenase [Chlamydiae bacterium RIFCSPHIGHO2_12_FULL_44_59]|nr:MAG: UDP-glucose 6-dehydrogenase [Chlamydiae bacterium RIFCSPHIGHO2_01_FULL_44_39]OGN58233.1 MAG: UDP-glucose 6-dehydrogenase [Chlamydiae bacterium RIFCSPHIGHO2_02_FULL_45_9]OGN59878.1 MAG: UDP-glucose 6-dehydrogenase [Chlamydiae bacterium RIFCSPHIGHO2_12_FULL_44_59]OGN66085.1 MAG: UDP-glucose 6-dehydrogenase [Chlamydiae bacterium RIFCSPLOWO2_01_FULL_44_52]OGN68621.1 MAG: UDP-glucose 6-dehydrogenase [Chlamydiae bacterium RIFCSPLOWO2_02_FULL_45_22]OGN69733.1 MAG: UDP-glucose 6-dehydrogenase 